MLVVAFHGGSIGQKPLQRQTAPCVCAWNRCNCRRLPIAVEYDAQMKSQRIGAAAPPWSWTIAVWTMIATFDATQNVLVMHSEGMHHRWVSLFANLLLAWLPWMAATPLVFYLGAKFPPTRLRPLRTWLVHAAAC